MFPVKDGAVRWLFGVVNRATQISVSSWMARDLPTSGSHAQIGATEKEHPDWWVKYYNLARSIGYLKLFLGLALGEASSYKVIL